MNALLVDAYDSFVYIIDQYLQSSGVRTKVLRCDNPALQSEVDARWDFVVLGPGPGRPEEAGYLQLLDRLLGTVPVLGVCLGHQAIGMAFGGQIVRAQRCMHGKTSVVLNDGEGLFSHTRGRPFTATRYHSLVVQTDGMSPDLLVSARAADDGHVMGLRHRHLKVESVQFHPESICTEGGALIFESFIRSHVLRPVQPLAERHAQAAEMTP